MSRIIDRIRANGGDLIRNGYAFTLRRGRLTDEQVEWVKSRIDEVKLEVWPKYVEWVERVAIIRHDRGLTLADAQADAYGMIGDA